MAADVSGDCDTGVPTAVRPISTIHSRGAKELKATMMTVAEEVLRFLDKGRPAV
jgi:hypothetical protein